MTRAEIARHLAYNADTGTFRWKYRLAVDMPNAQARGSWNARHAGKQAGSVDKKSGHVFIMINGKRHRAEKLAQIMRDGGLYVGDS